MSLEQSDIFNRYAALGAERTLDALFTSLRDDAKYAHVTRRQLARWSAQFHWSDLVRQVNDAAVESATKAIAPIIASMVAEQIDALHRVQRRFIERLAIDPADPDLSDDQRRRVIDPDFRDFQDAIRTEKLIIGDPTESKEHEVKDSALLKQLGRGDVIRMTIELAQKQFGAVTVVPPEPGPDDFIDAEVKELPSGD